jgi:hypothetical protein
MRLVCTLLGSLAVLGSWGCNIDCPVNTVKRGDTCEPVAPDAGSPDAGGESGCAAISCPAGQACSMASGSAQCRQTRAACADQEGRNVCDGADIVQCEQDGSARVLDTCQDALLCAASLTAGKCASCQPDTVTCAGSTLSTCASDGQSSTREDCESPQLCDEAAGACKQAACESGEYVCDGTWLKTCAADLTGWDEASAKDCGPELCSAADKRCRACVPGDRVCADGARKVCDAQGSMLVDAACASDKPVCVEGECVQCAANTDCQAQQTCQDASCVDSTALGVSDGEVGVFVVTVGRGYALDVAAMFKAADPITIMVDGSDCSLQHPGVGPGGDPSDETMQRSEGMCQIAKGDAQHTLTFRGPTGLRCNSSTETSDRIVLRYEDGFDDNCSDAVLTITASPL